LENKDQLRKVQFLMPQKRIDELDALREGAGMSRTAVFKVSLSLFKWWVEEVRQGHRILSIDKNNNTREVFLPGFEP